MICDCGHEVIVSVSGPSGYALTQNNQKICYSCAEQEEKTAFLQASKYSAYVAKKDNNYVITTWTGGHLARVTHMRKTNRRGVDSPWLYSVRAMDKNGGVWVGIGGGEGLYIQLRRIKAKK